MKLGMGIGPLGAPGGARIVELAKEAESLGYDTIWCPEIYGADCFTPLAWIGAHTERINLGTSIMQISARTPTSAAMQAATVDYLSNGRLILGIGVSGPQVVEGWYGQPYPKPLARTREWIQIFRKVIERKEPVAFDGDHYNSRSRAVRGSASRSSSSCTRRASTFRFISVPKGRRTSRSAPSSATAGYRCSSRRTA